MKCLSRDFCCYFSTKNALSGLISGKKNPRVSGQTRKTLSGQTLIIRFTLIITRRQQHDLMVP